MSESSSQVLSQELTAISDTFADLGERLLGAARQLHSPGAPPADALIEELASSRREFQNLRERVRGLAQSLEVPKPADGSLDTLQGLTALLDEVAAAETRKAHGEDLRRRSLSVLDRVLRLSHAGSPDFAPLREGQDKARALHESITTGSWSSLPDEAQHLAEGNHPFAHLLALVEERDALDDERWGTFHESVGAVFGKSLAAAAARSKLVAAAREPEPPAAPSAPESRPQQGGEKPSGGGGRRNLGRATPSSR